MSEADYINSLTAEIKAVDTCEELDALAKKAAKAISARMSGANSELATLKPILDLLENPAADLVKIAQWIGDFINTVLKPYYAPVVALAKEVEQDTAAVAQLTAAVAEKAAEIGSCAATFPATVVGDTVGGDS